MVVEELITILGFKTKGVADLMKAKKAYDAFVKGIRGNSRTLATAIGKSTGLFEVHSQGLKKNERAVAAFTRQVDRLGGSMRATTLSVTGLSRGYDQVGRSAKKARAEISRTSAAQRRADRMALLGSTALSAVPRRRGRAGAAPVPGSRAAARAARAGSAGSGLAAGAVGGVLARFAPGALIGGLAAGAAVKGTVGNAVSFEAAMAEVRKKANVPSEEAFAAIEKSIKRTSIELGVAQNDVAALTAEAAASGVEFQNLDRFIKLAAKASVGWDMTAQETSQKLAEIQAGTNMTIGEMETLADKINALGDNSAAKERNIVEMFHRSGAAAKEAGVDFDTTLATLTAVNSAGMQPEIASRWFNSFAGGLRTASEDSDDMVDGLKKLGLTVEQVKTGMKRNAAGTIVDFFERLEKSADAAEIAIKLFGKGWWDETLRAKGASAELRKQLSFLTDSKNYSGSLGKGLAVQLGTTENHLKRLSALSKDVGDRLARWTLPGINQTIETLITHMDELQRRKALADAGAGPDGPSDSTGRAVRKFKEGVGWVYDKALDNFLAPLPTEDRARKQSAVNMQEAADKEALTVKKRKEAAILEERAKKAGKSDRAHMRGQAAALRSEADAAQQQAGSAARVAGAAGGRDMTDVEVGEAYAKASIESRRRQQALEEAVSSGRRNRAGNYMVKGQMTPMTATEIHDELAQIRKHLGIDTAKVENVPIAGNVERKVPLPPARPDEFKPKVDASEIDAAKGKATEAEGVMKTALNGEYHPSVNTEQLEKAISLANVFAGVMRSVAAGGVQAVKTAAGTTAGQAIGGLGKPGARPAPSGGTMTAQLKGDLNPASAVRRASRDTRTAMRGVGGGGTNVGGVVVNVAKTNASPSEIGRAAGAGVTRSVKSWSVGGSEPVST